VRNPRLPGPCYRVGELIRYPESILNGTNVEFSKLEKAAIEAILSIPVDGMEMVRSQFAAASVVKREYTSVGFYTTISVPLSVPPMPDTQELHAALFGGASAHPKSDPGGWISFILWTHGGYITCLEGVTVRSSWPDERDIEDFFPCQMHQDSHLRPPVPERDLIPDCQNRFGTWRVSTSGMTLLKSAVLALIALVAIVVVLLLLASPYM